MPDYWLLALPRLLHQALYLGHGVEHQLLLEVPPDHLQQAGQTYLVVGH
jgi:hypothetical protein